jgi:tetratricopeptide (TPR) repeat protein
MKIKWIIGLLLFSENILAQYSLRFIVEVPDSTDEIFIAGNFNYWNPGESGYRLAAMKDGRFQVTIPNLSPAPYRFKFTRGDWGVVENDGSGTDIINRLVNLHADTTIYLRVRGWMNPLFDSSGNGHTVRFVVSGRVQDRDIYLVSDLTRAIPNDEKYKLNPLDINHQQIVVNNVSARPFVFGFTRGSWATVQTTTEGIQVNYENTIVRHDTTIAIQILGWADDYVDISKYPDTLAIKICFEKTYRWFYSNLDSAHKYAVAAKSLAERINSKSNLTEALSYMGRVQAEQGNSYKAIELFYRGLAIQKELNDSVEMAVLYNYIGDAFLQQNDTVKAMECYYNSIALIPKEKFLLPHQGNIVPPLTSLGKIFMNQHKLDSAEYYVWKAVDIGGTEPDWPLLLLGDTDKEKGDYKAALMQYKNAVKKALMTSEKSPFLAEALYKIASVFYETGEKDSAVYYARKAFIVASEIRNPYIIVSTGNMLINLFKGEHHLDSAFLYQEIVIRAKDSVFNKEKERQLQAAYYNEKIREQELSASNEKSKAQFRFYILLGGVIILLLLGLHFRSTLKANFYKKTAVVEMKALRAQMNPHFIFNCLTSINRYIVKSDHKQASNYLTKFAKLIRLILDNSAADYISLDTEIQTLRLYMDMESLRFDNAFEYRIETDDEVVSENICIPSMLVQPYAENAIWHGLLHLPDSQAGIQEKGKLWIRFMKESEKILRVEVEDQGVGRQKAKEIEGRDILKKKSYGMQISKDRIELINKLYKYNTSVKVEDLVDEAGNATGTKVVLTIPVNAIYMEKMNLS